MKDLLLPPVNFSGYDNNINVVLNFREGKSNAHLNGEYQRIGDVLLEGMKVLQV